MRETPATVVIAPDSFKGSASAATAAQALSEGWRDVRSADRVILAPMADGGEGTLDAFATAVPGAERRTVRVLGPDGDDVRANWLLLPDGTAVVELAETSGLGLMRQLRPSHAHTVGFGEAMRAALDAGARSLLLAIGGSASTDGGAGMLQALGARLLDVSGAPVPTGNRGLASIASVDLSAMRALPPGGARVLTDVTNPLLGPNGAAGVFAPQKGASPTDVPVLEANLRRFAAAVAAAGSPADPRTQGAGAAGGAGFGLLVWGAQLVPGSSEVARVIGLPALIGQADVVITGEGRFDEQSAAGKVPDQVAALAREAGATALLAAGLITAATSAFEGAVALTDLAGGSAAALAEPARWLREAGAVLARAYSD
ncbi:glycerate kinase [Leifsonia sp. AG29]|uniref:glycerate kinase n=1 Tax=Leifsonia sp. AG29 TaxID=2598860 RepID=UPI00131C6707|nr:glycerate kinase [Leifsonia sp. AG29]